MTMFNMINTNSPVMFGEVGCLIDTATAKTDAPWRAAWAMDTVKAMQTGGVNRPYAWWEFKNGNMSMFATDQRKSCQTRYDCYYTDDNGSEKMFTYWVDELWYDMTKFDLEYCIDLSTEGTYPGDNYDILVARAWIIDTVYRDTQKNVSTVEEAKASVEAQMAALDLAGSTVTVDDITFIAAIAGTPENIAGTNGSYTFVARVNKGGGTEQVYRSTLTIAATGYVETYTVEFIVDGEVFTTEVVEEGKAVKQPEDPFKPGYTFDYWRINDETGEIYDFDTPVTSDITLYAAWKEIQIEVPAITITSVSVGNGQANLDFKIKSANGKGYTVYLSTTGEPDSFKVYTNVNYNSKGAHIKGLVNSKEYWAYIMYSDGTFSNIVRFTPKK